MAEASAKPLCYSARLVRPFVQLLSAKGAISPVNAARFEELDADMRVPIALAERYLLSAVELSQEPQLGLLAGRSMTTGDCPALDYATSTASTVREAVDTAIKYARLANDALCLELEEDGDFSLLRSPICPLRPLL